MLKETLIVGVAAALGSFVVSKYGGQIEAKAVAMHIPVTVAHMSIVAGGAMLAYFVVRQVV